MAKSMKFDWDPLKNEWLKKERGVSFEMVIFHIHQGDVWREGFYEIYR